PRHRPLDGGADADVPPRPARRVACGRPGHPQGRAGGGQARCDSRAEGVAGTRREVGAVSDVCELVLVAHGGCGECAEGEGWQAGEAIAGVTMKRTGMWGAWVAMAAVLGLLAWQHRPAPP